ncbi:MAG: hypothetical protein HYX87_08820 [Chloroflexi bacterium]|nr:hypothetical protein [Chloroflexota bacterium]
MAGRLRALVASEPTQVRHLLVDALEREPGVVVVGQADSAVKAVGLARSLRPEVVLVDFQLPHRIGLDAVPLTRTSGLDAAMDISRELGKTKVLLVTNAGLPVQQESVLGKEVEAFLYTQTAAASQPVDIRKLFDGGVVADGLVFAKLGTRERISDSNRIIEISEKLVAFSSLVILGGLGLMVTLFLASAGVFLAAAGAAGLLLGVTARVAGGLALKRRKSALKPEVVKPKWLKVVRDDDQERPQTMLDI